MATNAILGPAWLVAQDWAQPVDEVGTSESVAATTAAQDSDTEDEVGTSIRRRATPEQMDLSVLSQGGSLRKRVNSLIAEALRCPNKGKLEEFLDNLDACLSRMTREPDNALLLTIVEPLLRQAPELEMDFNIFDRAAPGSFESTLGFLYTAARAACERKRRQEMLQSMLPAPPKQVAPIIKSKPKGKYLMAFTGVVKKYFAEKGFGFVTPDDGGADVFVHVRDNPELQDCEIGTAVTYDSEFDDRRGKYKGINCCPSDGCAAWHYEEEDDEQEAEIDLSSCLWEPPPPGTWVQVLFDDGHWYWGRLQEDCGGTQAVIGYHTGPLTGDYGQVDFEVDYVWKPDPDAHAGADDACDDEADQETGLLDIEYDEGTDVTDHGPDPLGVD